MSDSSSSAAPGYFSRENPVLYLAPMFVYLLLGTLEPSVPDAGEVAGQGLFDQAYENSNRIPVPTKEWSGLTYDHYPAIYTVKLLITIGVLALCAPAWRQWKFRITWLGPAVGVVGAALWIGICEWHPEGQLVRAVGEDNFLISLLGFGPRAAFNPIEYFGPTALCYAFLVVRFIGLALVVPVFEELLLRGWLMRHMVSPEFWRVEFGRVTLAAVVVGTAFPMLYHPEKVAALVWFSLVTWLMVRTRNYWDCVAAHGVTNLLLGLYVLWAGAWHLW